MTLEKPPLFSDSGELLGFEDFDPQLLAALRVAAVMDYETYLVGEVSEADLARFRAGADQRLIPYAVRRDLDLVQVNGYSFSSFGEPVGLPQDLVLDAYDGELQLYLVQLKAPVTPEWRAGIEGHGDVLAYFPENTYLVRAPAAALPSLRAVDGVQHVSLHQPAYKVRTSLLDLLEPVDVAVELDAGQDLAAVTALLESATGGPVDVRHGSHAAYAWVRLGPSDLRALVRRPEVLWVEPALKAVPSGEREASIVSGQHNGLRPIRFTGGAGGHNAWLRSKGFCTPTDYVPWPGCYPYWTKIGVVDTGLDRSLCTSYNESTGLCSAWDSPRRLHPDLNHNSNHISACPPPGEGPEGPEGNEACSLKVIRPNLFCAEDKDGDNLCLVAGTNSYEFSDIPDPLYAPAGHGTAVTSIIVGDPLSKASGDPDPPFDDYYQFYAGTGIAPSAQIIVARYVSIAPDPYTADAMTHETYKQLVAKLTGSFARFVTNSWNLYQAYGLPLKYEYTLFSQVADELVRDADGVAGPPWAQTTLVFSAGNWQDGTTSVTSPGNAKNVISVGASQGWSESVAGRNADEECALQAHQIDDIAGFVGGLHSRRGYYHELGGSGALPRYKPDLVAPGTQCAAARSMYTGDTNIYQCFGGTSAAAPAVTAAAVLAEAWHYYVSPGLGDAGPKPSPAMLRAMLSAHADNLVGGTDYLPNPDEELTDSPSLPQGWGRVNLEGLFHDQAISECFFDQEHRFTATGEKWSVQLTAGDPAERILIVMVYTDCPSQAGATILTVNDLDLRVFNRLGGSNGRRYWGNYFNHQTDPWYSDNTFGEPLPEAPLDPHNTVEVVRVYPGELTGTFIVTVGARGIVGEAVPGADGGADNQDFALYVYNATVTE